MRWWTRREIQTIRSSLAQYEGLPSSINTITLKFSSDFDCPEAFACLPRVGVIELENPTSKNALTGKMMAELAEIVDLLETPATQQHLRAVVLRGKQATFCAGADFHVATTHLASSEGGEMMSALMIDTLTRLHRLPLITCAVIEGAAIGGGAELATATDFRVADATAFIQFVQAKMGVSPGWGGGTRLVQALGQQKALQLLATAQRYSAPDAHIMGLLDRVTMPNESIEDAATSFLRQFDGTHRDVLQAMKQVVASPQEVYEASLLKEHDIFKGLWGGSANLAALAHKRKKY